MIPLGWSDDDQSILLAYHAEQALICAGCGQFLDVSSDPAAEHLWVADPVCCFACATKEVAARAFHSDSVDGKAGDVAGMKWGVQPHERGGDR